MTDTLATHLDARTMEGLLARPLPDGAVRCVACGHRCLIRDGRRGICRVRFNQGGKLRVPRGYVAGVQCDPVEKKPFFHVLPGADALTFGMLGCDFHCGYCQNWVTSQALRDDHASTEAVDVTAEALVALAERQDARLVVSSYNEPLSIPWHVTAFHEDYRFWGMGNTTAEVLVRACEIGAEEGLNFVYAGNLPGRVGRWEHTWCPTCQGLLIERLGYWIHNNRVATGGSCPDCGTPIPGIFANPRGSSEPSRGHGSIRPLTV